jgi:guanylate kinase
MNELKHGAEFRSVLEGYRPSPAAMDILQQTELVLLVGPTASGRNTIIRELVNTGEYYHPVPDTTRQIRIKDGQPIEKNGREYWFRSEEEVLDGLHKGQYVEAAIIHNQQVSGRNIKELSKALGDNKIAVEDIEPVGAQFMYELKPDTIIIFILPPSFEAWMQRLLGRGGVDEDEIRRRLISAREELTAALECDYYKLVVNDKLEESIAEIQLIVKQGLISSAKQSRAQELARDLDQAIKEYLSQTIIIETI